MIVSEKEVITAYRNFIKLFHPNSTSSGSYFWNFIGDKSRHFFNDIGQWDLPPEAVKKVRALAGPHHVAMAKVMVLNGADPFNPVNPVEEKHVR